MCSFQRLLRASELARLLEGKAAFCWLSTPPADDMIVRSSLMIANVCHMHVRKRSYGHQNFKALHLQATKLCVGSFPIIAKVLYQHMKPWF